MIYDTYEMMKIKGLNKKSISQKNKIIIKLRKINLNWFLEKVALGPRYMHLK